MGHVTVVPVFTGTLDGQFTVAFLTPASARDCSTSLSTVEPGRTTLPGLNAYENVLCLLVSVTVTSALPPPLSFTSQVKVLPFSCLTSSGQEADVICVVEVESDELSIPCSTLLASTVSSLPQAESPSATAARATVEIRSRAPGISPLR